jgi:UDP-N-acetyl-D-glucosamine dehydrogenase
MPSYVANKIRLKHNGTLANKKVLLVGVSYKANVSDTRESPTYLLHSEFRKMGCDLNWYDPLVDNWLPGKISEFSEAYFDIIVICQVHDCMDLSLIKSKGDFVFDASGRGLSDFGI